MTDCLCSNRKVPDRGGSHGGTLSGGDREAACLRTEFENRLFPVPARRGLHAPMIERRARLRYYRPMPRPEPSRPPGRPLPTGRYSPPDRHPPRPENFTPLRERPPLSPEVLADRSLDPPETLPTIELKAPTWHPHLFRRRLGAFDPAASHGDLVRVATTDGATFGHGLFNPRAEIAVRLLSRGEAVPGAAWWRARLVAAVGLRREVLRLDGDTEAMRLVHAEGDGLPGLMADRYGPVLSAEIFSLALWQRRAAMLTILKELSGAEHVVVRPGPRSAELEGFDAGVEFTPDCPESVTVAEHGVSFELDVAAGHKTGFFCDQRDNRRLVAGFAGGRSVLDLCCYTGGFALAAHRGRGSRGDRHRPG